MACRVDQMVLVTPGMIYVPDVSMREAEQLAWTCPTQVPITVKIPDPKLGDPPYNGNPFPSLVQTTAYTWDSCALTPASNSPIPYSVSFPTNNKKIFGRIIILRPLKGRDHKKKKKAGAAKRPRKAAVAKKSRKRTGVKKTAKRGGSKKSKKGRKR